MLYYIISFCLINGYFKHLKEDDITEHIFGDDILSLYEAATWQKGRIIYKLFTI